MTTANRDHVLGDRAVLHALLSRRASGSTPDTRTDPYRIALVVSGGGMRGSYPAGMAYALERAGLRDAFDVAYGTSAGAFVAAAFLTHQSASAERVFADDMTHRDFIDLRRLGTRRPVVSLDHLFDNILGPVSWDEIRDVRVPLRVIATCAERMSAHALDGQRTAEDWKLALRATSSIPYLAGPPTTFGGKQWIDGSVSEPIAIRRALADGATHVLVLLSRAPDEVRVPTRHGRSPAWARLLDRAAPGLGAMARDVRHYATSLDLVADAAHPDRGAAHLLVITPNEVTGVQGLTTDAARVRRASEVGRSSAGTAVELAGEPCG